ncbi:hypothetical protein [Streptomyces sp. NPDC048623]|uniref:hypothetical protein n=1 Tax=Streptomyces sp. NPDC048623 TaxID=3155761 RepID=UPI0034318E8A
MARATGRRTGGSAAVLSGTADTGTSYEPYEDAASRGGLVAVVVATPSDALPLLSAQAPGRPVAVVSLWHGEPGELDDLARRLDRAAAAGAGPRPVGPPLVLGLPECTPDDPAALARAESAVLDALAGLDPLRVATLDPDPASVPVPDGERKYAVIEPPRRGFAALAALRAARRHQTGTGVPVFVDCRRAAVDPRAPLDLAARYPRPVRWLTTGTDGRLSVHLLSAGGVLRWTEHTPGGPGWTGPEPLDTPDLMPGLSVVQGPDGYVRLLGLRRTASTQGPALDVVTAVQYQSGRPLGPWTPVGNPNAREWHKARRLGFPVGAFDASGTFHVFVRNVGASISTRRQDPAGRWSAWEHLRGRKVADELVAFPAWDGGVELVARVRDGVAAVHWHYDPATGAWTEDRSVPVSAVPGSLSAAPEAGALRYRYAETSEVCVWQPGTGAPVGLGGGDGTGPVAGVAGAGIQGWSCTVLVRTGHDQAPSVGAHADGRPDLGVWWAPHAAGAEVPPAVALDGRGRVVIATLGPDGVPLVARQRPDVQGLEFGGWQSVHQEI